MDPILRWFIELRLQLIEEAACGPQDSGTGAPGMEEGRERISRSLGRDWKADEQAIVDYMRAEVRKWWRDFPEQRLLTDLYKRAALRRAGCGTRYSRRRPCHSEGLRVASGLLADVPKPGPLDAERESAAVSEVLATLLSPPIGVSSPGALREYIERSEASRACFDALERIYEELHNRGKRIPSPLYGWRAQVAGGRRRRPARMPVPPHRPVKPAHLLRDLQIQFTIELLRRVGVRPRGSPVSGCRIVAEALKLLEGTEDTEDREDTVVRIWKEGIWKRPFEDVMRKHSKAIATRTGLDQTH